MKKLTFLFALLCASVMGWAAPATYTGAGFSGAINGYSYDIGYSITYDDDHHLTFNVTLDGTFKETAGFVFEVWSSDLSTENFKSLAHGEGNNWSITDDKDYSSMSGQALNQLRLRLASQAGGTDQLYMSDYTVGLSGAAVTSGPANRAPTPTANADKVKAIYSWYYAKNCNFADWGGGTSSQNMRFGKKLACSKAEGTGWGGLVDFGDLDCSGMDKLHMDIWVENDASVRISPIHYAYGNEYRHTINLTGGQWNSIELELNGTNFISDASQGAPDDYWDVINQFKLDLWADGLSFWIDNFYFYSDQQPVFTSIAITGNTLCKIGETTSLTIETLDQFGHHIDAEYTCTVTPSSAGTVEGTTYTPLTKGPATITATSGLISNTLNVFNYQGSNLALNNALVGVGTSYGDDVQAKAVDGNDGTVWQGSTTNGKIDDSKIYNAWFVVDLKAAYDLDLVTIHFEGACSDAYKLYGSANNSDWTEIYSWAYPNPGDGNRIDNHTDIITSADLTNASNVRYVKFLSTRAATEWGVKIYEFQVFGSESASLTKSVSASVNNPAMGTATVKQEGVDVTEVEAGSTVTFSAVANDGYIFVEWSNGNTNATFDAVVSSAMNLTATFRELGTTYCNTVVHSSNGGQEHDAYVTMRRTAENTYQLIVRAEYQLGNFSNTEFRIKEEGAANTSNYNLNNHGVLSADKHTLTGTITSVIEPEMISGKLYVNIVGQWEGQFDKLTNIEFSQPCADPEVTAIALDKTEATLELGNTLTLIPSFTPAYLSADITWLTSDESKATVANGVVTPVALGEVTITAKVSETIQASCAVTVSPITGKTCWGKGNDFTYNDKTISYYYAFTRNANKTLTVKTEFSHDITGLGNLNVVWGDVWHLMSYNAATKSATFTTEETYEAGVALSVPFFYFEGRRTDVSYTVGDECDKPAINVTSVEINHTSLSLTIGENATVTASVVPANADDKVIVWENSNPSVASFNTTTGEVIALAVGTTTITAKSHYDESILASCEVEVVAALTQTTWHGYGTFTPQEGLTGFSYTITRNVNRSLTYTVVLDKNPEGFVGEINIEGAGTYSGMTYTASTRTATYTTAEDFAADGQVFHSFWWLKSANNVDRVDFDYTVGSENAELPQVVTINETMDNSSALTTLDGQTVICGVGRSFTADNLYTLVLPFSADAALTAEKLPGQLTKLNNTIVKDNGDLKVNFVDASAIEAGVPYLYVPSADVVNPVFAGVTVSKDLNPTEPADGRAKYYGLYAPTTGSALKAISNAYVLGSDQYLYAVAGLRDDQPMKALRGYFVLNFPASQAPNRTARVIFNYNDAETATGIESIQTSECSVQKFIENGQLFIIREGKTYNAQGQLIK